MTMQIWTLSALMLPLITGCAAIDQSLPVLGTVEAGVYQQPDSMFQCPLPNASQGFQGEVTIIDAGKITRTRQVVIPVDERKPWEGPLRTETIYPAEIVAIAQVRFTDAADDKRRLEVSFRPLRPDEDPETVLTSGYAGGNYGLLQETRGTLDGFEYGMAVLQLPYFTKGPGYMGVDLWESYLTGDDPGPDIDVFMNVIVEGHHYVFQLRTTSLEFLPSDVNPKDLMAVNDVLKADTKTQAVLKERLLSFVQACRLTP
jgi:hypothetical protein